MLYEVITINKEGDNYVVEASVRIPFGKLFAVAEHENLFAAINSLEQKLERQMIRHIHRPDSRRHVSVKGAASNSSYV